MKTYLVYVNGQEKGTVKAANQKAAEKKAQKKFPEVPPQNVSVEYTEVWNLWFRPGGNTMG